MVSLLDLFFKRSEEFIITMSFGNKILRNRKEILNLLKKDKNYQVGLLYSFHESNNINYSAAMKELVNYDKGLSKIVEFAYEVMKYDTNLISLFPKLKTHPKIKLVQLSKYPERFLDYQDWHNEKKAIIAVRFNPVVYRYLPENLKKNEKVILNTLQTSVLYPKKEKDILYGMYFDLPLEQQQNKKIIHCALKNNPSIFNNLNNLYKKDHSIILAALKKGFYEKDISAFYDLQNIIPYINECFYENIANIKWILKGFENNVEEASMYTDCAMLIFCSFMRSSSKKHDEIKDFFETMGIKNRFEKMLKKHQFKLYSDDMVPTGIEPEANKFFEDIFPNLSNKFEQFLLMKNLEKKLTVNDIQYLKHKI